MTDENKEGTPMPEQQPQTPVQPDTAAQVSAAINAVGNSMLNNFDALRRDTSISFWIKGMKILAWIIFVLGIIGGFVLAISAGRAGWGSFSFGAFLGVLLGSWLLSFLSVAGIMIFLDMARDMSKIKQMMRKKM